MLCLVVAQQCGRRGTIVSGWKMPFLEQLCHDSRAVAAPAGRPALLTLLAASGPTKEQFCLGRKGWVTLIAPVLDGWKLS